MHIQATHFNKPNIKIIKSKSLLFYLPAYQAKPANLFRVTIVFTWLTKL